MPAACQAARSQGGHAFLDQGRGVRHDADDRQFSGRGRLDRLQGDAGGNGKQQLPGVKVVDDFV